METEDAYAELGLEAGASEQQVKAAWRRLVSRWHPDRNPSPQALVRMQRINLAFERLRQSFEDGDEAPATSPRGPVPEPPPPARAPWHIHRTVKLTLEEGARGGRRVLRGRHTERCAECEGRGWRHSPRPCEACHGAGRLARRGWFGWVAGFETCETCSGDGLARLECEACDGHGHRGQGRYEVTVELPAGLRDGDALDLAGGAQGDRLLLRVKLREHPFFTLAQDGTLGCEVPVDGFLWMANRWIEVPGLQGPQSLRLDRRHLRYRLRGQGYPRTRGGKRADCVIDVKPLFPAELEPEAEALVDRLASLQAAVPGSPLNEWRQRFGRWRARRD